MATIVTNANWLQVDGARLQKGKWDLSLTKAGVRLSDAGERIDIPYEGTTIDGDIVGSAGELFAFFEAQGFKTGGGTGEGVQSVSGDLVDDTDPNNPKVNMLKIDQGSFLVGGSSSNEQRKILPSDIGVGSSFSVPYVGSDVSRFHSGGLPLTASNEPDTIAYRTPTGAGKFAPASSPDEAVVLSQHQSDLESKVDKVSGKGLSDTNFTADEKSKLAGLEDVHYKGWFPSLTALQTNYPTSDEGAHAFVDDVSGSVLYIWDVDTTAWVSRIGESTEMTPAQAKVLYESNPDTNAFTDDEKSKLAGIASEATKNNTDATLLSRANHTGTQSISTITGLQTALDAKYSTRGAISPAIPALRAAHVGILSLSNTSYTEVTTWNSQYDFYGMNDGNGNLVIPSWASYARVIFSASLPPATKDSRSVIRVRLNTTQIALGTNQVRNTEPSIHHVDTGIIPVSGGQSFNAGIWHNYGAPINLNNTNTFINVELFESV